MKFSNDDPNAILVLCFPVNLFNQWNISERQVLALKTRPWLEHLSVSHLATSPPDKCTILQPLSQLPGLLRRVWVCVCVCVCVFWGLSSSRYSTPYWPGSPFSEQRTIPTETKQSGKRTVPEKHSHTESLSQSYARSRIRDTSQGNTRMHTHKNSRPPQKHGGLCLCLAA